MDEANFSSEGWGELVVLGFSWMKQNVPLEDGES